jgi:tape measure domain-containing protein
MSTYQLGIDGTPAEAGAKRIVKSFEDIKAAAARMESGATKSFSGMARAFKELSSLSGVRSDTLRNFREFSNAISSFKGPSQANLANTKKFFDFMKSINGFKAPSTGGLKAFLDPLSNFKGPSAQSTASVKALLKSVETFKTPNATGFQGFLNTLTNFKGPSAASAKNVRTLLQALTGFSAPRVGNIAPFLSILSGYKGPSQASAKNTANLLKALNGFTPPRATAGFNSFLSALAAYRGPSASAGKNTLALLRALASFTPPRNMGNSIRGFQDLATAIDKAAGAMSRLRAGSRGSVNVPGLGGTRGATRELGDLTRQYGFLETAVLRTQTALNAIGGIFGVKFIADAANQIVKIRSQLEAATGSVQQARVQFEFLKEQTNRLGLEFVSTAKSYGMLLGSIKGTSVTFAEVQQIFMGFSTAARALQLSTDDVDGVFRALGQIMSKGKLQAEELRGQLGDRLPGAFVRFAVALKMTKPGELDEALKKGAISGDKLKTAILSVANTMENEFAVSADKMSKTVDAAFNRLKNAFTFSADEFGQSGFNSFLISFADALRKLMESSTVDKVFSSLGKVLQFVGDNIEAVSSLITGVAIVSFLKWATTAVTTSTALTGLGTTLKIIQALAFGTTAQQMALGLGSMGASTTVLGRAMIGLRAVMASMGWPLLVAAIGAAVYALSQFKTKQDEANDAIRDHTKNTAELENIYDAYIAQIYNSTGALDGEIAKTRQLTLERLAAARAAIGNVDPVRFSSRASEGARMGGRAGADAATAGGLVDWWKGDVISGKDAAAIRRLVDRGGRPLQVRNDTDAVELSKRLSAAEAQRRITPFDEAGEKVFQAAQAGWNVYRQEQKIKGNTNLDKMLGDTYGDYNRSVAPPGISGDVPSKPDKAGKGANQYRNAIQNAIDAFTDLDTKAKATQSLIENVSNGALDSVAAAARAQAVSRVEDFEQAFKGENIAKRQAGIISIAKAMDLQAGSYGEAKAALISYYAAAEEKQARLDNDRKTQDNITSLREENEIRDRYVDAIRLGGDALAQANIQMEVEKQLLNGSTQNREALTQQLTDQLKRQLELNRAEKAAAEMNGYDRAARVNSQIAQTYNMGLNSEDLANAQDLIRYHDELNEAYGKDSPYVAFFLNLRQAAQANEHALKEAADQYEAVRQVSEDVAAAISDSLADAFKNGYSEGDTFLSKFKSLFKNLKDILLDFVLFNPLKKFLTDSLTATYSGSMGNRQASSSVSSSSANISDMVYAGGDLINSILSPATKNTSMSNIAQATRATGSSIGPETGEVAGDIIVRGINQANEVQFEKQQKASPFSALKKVFDYKTNGANLSDGLKDIGDSFKSSTKGITGKLGKLGDGLGKIGQAAGNAFAAYGAGSGVAKMLGLGKGGQKIAGMASAGFSLGGPIGGAIGAAIGTGMALFMKTKVPAAWGNVSVNAAGATQVSAGKYGKGSLAEGQAMGNAGAAVFSQFAYGYGGELTAGDYGAFGKRKLKNDGVKGESYFYSTEGVTKKGKPVGQKGVDWISSDDQSVVQAFALMKQIQSGAIAGLDEVYKTIAKITPTGSTLDTLQNNLTVGTSYLNFIDSAKIQTDTQKQIDQLAKSFKTLSQQSKALGLDTNKLDKAYAKLLKTYKDTFDLDIDQQILEITDPLQAAYNSLLTEYQDTVANAMAVGGDLADVEKLYGLKRAELAKQYAEEATNSVASMAKDLLTQLTSSSASPLSANEVLKNAGTDYEGLRKEILSGDFSNAGKLQEYAGNYLDAARDVSKSSYDYFQVFDEVTDFLKLVQNTSSITTPENLPELPGVQTLVDKIGKQNDDLLATTKDVGAAIVDSTATAEEIGNTTNSYLAEILALAKSGLVTQAAGAVLSSTTKTPSM